MIKECTTEHITEYGKIYATAFSGEPWNDNWIPENAEIHISEIMESKQSYGYEESNLLGFCRLFFINISLKSLAMRQHSFVFCLI